MVDSSSASVKHRLVKHAQVQASDSNVSHLELRCLTDVTG